MSDVEWPTHVSRGAPNASAFLLFMIEGSSRDPTEKMVVIGNDHRDNAEVDITENMDNNQSGDELVPRTEQNNDEVDVR